MRKPALYCVDRNGAAHCLGCQIDEQERGALGRFSETLIARWESPHCAAQRDRRRTNKRLIDGMANLCAKARALWGRLDIDAFRCEICEEDIPYADCIRTSAADLAEMPRPRGL